MTNSDFPYVKLNINQPDSYSEITVTCHPKDAPDRLRLTAGPISLDLTGKTALRLLGKLAVLLCLGQVRQRCSCEHEGSRG